ncbi:MAG: heme-binding domain-containing protein [Ignavibacteriales bacterium]|nr:heme-binding domain-containing protein [Ignavibacteriales bacterium]
MKYKHIVKVFFVVTCVIFVLIQFIQPNRDNPQFDPAMTMQAELNVPANIVSLLDRGCYDCHSNETRWPFYAYVAPASWLVSYDVSEGRKHFNMSEWGKYRMSKKASILGGINSAVKEKEMPLPKYIPLHPEADLTDAERDTLAAWAQSAAEELMGGGEEE